MTMTLTERVLGVRALNGTSFKSFASSRLDGFFQDLFRRGGEPLSPDAGTTSRSVEYEEIVMPLDAAPFTSRSAPATVIKGLDRKLRTMVLADIKLKRYIPESRLFSERYAGGVRPNAESVIADEQMGLLKRINYSRELFAAKTLQSGGFDSSTITGNELDFTVDFSVQTANASAAWSTAGTKIVSSELPALKDTYYSNCRMDPGMVIVDKETHRSLRGNTEVQTWFAPLQNSDMRRLQSDKIIGPENSGFDLDGMRWLTNRAGHGSSLSRYMSDGKVIVLPEEDVLGDVLKYAEGYGAIPEQAIGNPGGLIRVAPNRGVYSYATSSEDPVGVNLYVGAVFAFIVAWNDAVLEFDTTP